MPLRYKVVVAQYRLLHYRTELFEKLRSSCAESGIDFCLVHGQPTASELKKRDVGTLDWADVVTNQYINLKGRDVLWQPYPDRHRDASLVVVMQENRLLSNYPWLFWRNGTEAKVAYWGHGRNFQTDSPTGIREKWKKFLVGRVDWWFAYTQKTRDILLADGYPDQRITVLDNAIDNEAFCADLAAVTEMELLSLRHISGVGPIGLFCGSLYPDKRIDFMIAVADRIRSEIPSFSLVVIGSGPSSEEIHIAAKKRPWLLPVGVKKGRDKAAWFKMANVILNPGAVGLHVLDAFAAGVPMATTSDARHGPEIAYLEAEKNGLITDGTVDAYAQAVISLLSDQVKYSAIRAAGFEAAKRYTLENMVDQFRDGIERCLIAPKKK